MSNKDNKGVASLGPNPQFEKVLRKNQASKRSIPTTKACRGFEGSRHLQSLINMMHGDCLVRTPMRPWSPRLCDSEVHNDSGISPGRSSSIAPSTSPQSPCIIRGSPEQYPDSPADSSRHFRGSPNSPSLPERYPRISNPTSPNSNGLPGDSSFRDSSNHAFSPYHTDSSPPGPADSSLERLKMALERSTALAGVYKTEDDGKDRDQAENAARKEFPCPLCAYTTPYRHRYMEHVSTHYSDKCTLCDFKGQNVIELRTHLSEAHGVTEGDLSDLADPTDQPDSTPDGPEDDENPRRGKSKHFRCKQCTFVTTTKVDFWEHTKTHIKAEKLLTCPKCPFVTEYKHHLEYHLRNHFGSKPFKCNKCSYSCVNKSMLNSHLKSHSNVYQYRCADCAYATKYCHSLKLHLRKYDHNPAVVLNQDGSPNPLPIIDVYGTRRGPKQKPKPAEDCEKSSLPGGIVVPPAPHGMQHAEEVRPKLMGCNLCEFYTGSMEILNQHMYAHATESPFAHMFRTNNNLPDQGAIKDYLQTMMISMEPPASPLSLVSPHHSPMAFQPASPLDLSKSEPESRDEQRPRDERKNRRKGKAYKLERPRETKPMQVDEPICMVKRETTPEKSSSVDEELMGGKYNGNSNGAFDFSVSNRAAVVQSDKDGTRHESNHTNPSPPALNPYDLCETKLDEPQQDFKVRITSVDIKQERMGEPEETQVNGGKSDAEGYTCDYCDMAFKDVVMYTMHMGYHGYRNPFTCNMCGHETTNRVSFFLHIARQSHT